VFKKVKKKWKKALTFTKFIRKINSNEREKKND
jgi:hypothetical protein